MSDTREKALELLGVSRETSARLELFVVLLRRWSGTINLISKRDLDEVWLRHIADSGQLLRHASTDELRWADIGSGAGFPGAVLGIIFAERPGAEIHLIESDQRKAAFLRAVSRETGAPVTVHNERAETVLPAIPDLQVITSRATASLSKLIAWCAPNLQKGAAGLFLKGESVAKELTEIEHLDRFSVMLIPSVTHSSGRIVKIRAC